MVHACHPSTWEAKEDSCKVKTSLVFLHSEFQATLGYIRKLCLEKGKQKKRITFLKTCDAELWLKSILVISLLYSFILAFVNYFYNGRNTISLSYGPSVL